MGYFSPLQKCARNSSGWGGWSALDGADYVAEYEKCVVYRAAANYAAGESGIAALSIGTNFVNPLTSGTAATAGCYLYTFDPTSGGSAAVTSPPGGYIAAASAEFSASNVGRYILFSFPEIAGTPEALYFWFTSSVSTAAYGSNQIYHYATGNWNAALGTGTRTPAIYGGLSGGTGGSGGGGVSGVDRFTVKDCGTRLNMPQSPWSGSMSMSVGEIGRMCVSFDFSVQTDIIVTSSGVDLASGTPTAEAIAGTDGQTSAADVEFFAEEGRDYWIYITADEVLYALSARLGVYIAAPPARYFAVTESAKYEQVETALEHSASPGESGVVRLELTFKKSGAVLFSSSAAAGTHTRLTGALSRGTDIFPSTGDPVSAVLASGTGAEENYSFAALVEAGVTYYFFSRDLWLYAAPTFTIHIRPVPGAMHILADGEEKNALPYIYASGAWHSAAPMLYSSGRWHTGI